MKHQLTQAKYDEWRAIIGEELFTSDWLAIDGERLEQYHQSALLTATDIPPLPENPHGDDLVDGTYLISLILHFKHNLSPLDDTGFYALNYGYDKVRFVSPVAVGDRVRLRQSLTSVEIRDGGRIVTVSGNLLELEGADKPALVADSISMYLPQDTEGGAADE